MHPVSNALRSGSAVSGIAGCFHDNAGNDGDPYVSANRAGDHAGMFRLFRVHFHLLDIRAGCNVDGRAMLNPVVPQAAIVDHESFRLEFQACVRNLAVGQQDGQRDEIASVRRAEEQLLRVRSNARSTQVGWNAQCAGQALSGHMACSMAISGPFSADCVCMQLRHVTGPPFHSRRIPQATCYHVL